MRRREYDYVVAWPQVIGMLLEIIKGLTLRKHTMEVYSEKMLEVIRRIWTP